MVDDMSSSGSFILVLLQDFSPAPVAMNEAL